MKGKAKRVVLMAVDSASGVIWPPIVARAVSQVTQGLPDEEAKQVRQETRQQLKSLIHQVLDAATYEQAKQALLGLIELPWAEKITKALFEHLDRLLFHTLAYCQDIQRVGPECYWRDFCLRLSRGRNHRSDLRLKCASLIGAIYHNFTPAQTRIERKRRHRNPGLSPLEVAGQSPENHIVFGCFGRLTVWNWGLLPFSTENRVRAYNQPLVIAFRPLVHDKGFSSHFCITQTPLESSVSPLLSNLSANMV